MFNQSIATCNKTRMICANCGFVFDIFGIFNYACPQCGSNACDEVNNQIWSCNFVL